MTDKPGTRLAGVCTAVTLCASVLLGGPDPARAAPPPTPFLSFLIPVAPDGHQKSKPALLLDPAQREIHFCRFLWSLRKCSQKGRRP